MLEFVFFFASRFSTIVNWFVRLVYRTCFVENIRKWKKKQPEKQTTTEQFVANFREFETRRKKGTADG